MSTYGLGAAPRMEYRNVIGLLYDNKWHDVDNLLRMGSTVCAESGCYPHAWHWNSPAEGGNGSVDWGLFQLNDNNQGGSAPSVDADGDPIPVTQFQKDALDPTKAVLVARKLYEARQFQPWYGYSKWLNYAPQMSRAIANFLRAKYNIPLL